jgi:hypothetical protein
MEWEGIRDYIGGIQGMRLEKKCLVIVKAGAMNGATFYEFEQ